MESEHHLGCQFDEVDFQDLGDEWEASGSPEVALDDFDCIFLCEELDVERSGNAQRTCNGSGYLLDPADGLDVKLLRRELDGGISGMDSGIFDVL